MEETESTFATVLRRAAAAERDVIDLVNGAPDWEPPAALRDGLREAADAEPAELQYPPTPGLGDLREELGERRGVDPDSVLVTAGATEANHLATAEALDRSDGQEVLLADPYYPYYPRRIDRLGGRPVTVPVRDDGVIDVAAVAEAAGPETAAIIINTPNNPMGVTYGRDILKRLVGVAEDHDALLISDETYAHLDLSGSFVSALTIESENRLVTSSMSKSMAVTGLRVGYLVSPTHLRDPLFDRHELTTVSASRPAQAAVLEALRETDPTYYRDVRERLAERVQVFTDALESLGAEFRMPDMGFYVMAELPGLSGDLETIEWLIEEVGVAAMPGSAFGDSQREAIRFALVSPRVEAAADRLGGAIDGQTRNGGPPPT